MILTDNIVRKMCTGDRSAERLIEPFSEDSLQSESYDLTVGSTIAVLKKEFRCLDLELQDEIDNIYEVVDLPLSGYTLSPKEFVLVSLREKINLPENITAHIRPRTRFTRLGLMISAQHCNSTYSGYLNLGLFNATDYAIKLMSGIKIAQIVFEELKEKPSTEKMYRNKPDAAYQNERKFVGARFSDEFEKKVNDAVNTMLKRNN